MTSTDAVSAIFVPYGQGRARGLGEDELGNHGVDVDRLVALGLPVVPGLTVPISHAASLGEVEVARVAVDILQQLVGRHNGDVSHCQVDLSGYPFWVGAASEARSQFDEQIAIAGQAFSGPVAFCFFVHGKSYPGRGWTPLPGQRL